MQLPEFLHFGVGLPDPAAVRALRERFEADGVEIHEWWDEPEYVSVKCRDPDGYVVEASWEPKAPFLREPRRNIVAQAGNPKWSDQRSRK